MDAEEDNDPGGQRSNIIVGLKTADATVPDTRTTDPIRAALVAHGLLHTEHYLTPSYPYAALVIDSLHRWCHAVTLPLANQSRQARAGAGYGPDQLAIDSLPGRQPAQWTDKYLVETNHRQAGPGARGGEQRSPS